MAFMDCWRVLKIHNYSEKLPVMSSFWKWVRLTEIFHKLIIFNTRPVFLYTFFFSRREKWVEATVYHNCLSWHDYAFGKLVYVKCDSHLFTNCKLDGIVSLRNFRKDTHSNLSVEFLLFMIYSNCSHPTQSWTSTKKKRLSSYRIWKIIWQKNGMHQSPLDSVNKLKKHQQQLPRRTYIDEEKTQIERS